VQKTGSDPCRKPENPFLQKTGKPFLQKIGKTVPPENRETVPTLTVLDQVFLQCMN
jgi:hypothetical protein